MSMEPSAVPSAGLIANSVPVLLPTKSTSPRAVKDGEASISPRFTVAKTEPEFASTFHKLGCEVPVALLLVNQTAFRP